jgi:thioredoxin reductase
MQRDGITRREALRSLGAGAPVVIAVLQTKGQKQMLGKNEKPEESEEYDVIVVGGSFAGLSAAMQLVRARRRVLILDTDKPRNRFAHASHGFFGHDGRPPREMIETARRQVLVYPTARFERAEALQATGESDRFRVTRSDGTVSRARRLVLATGITDHLPEIPGMKELWGTGVAHCPYCHGYEVAGRPIAILASSEKSIHQALLLRDWSDDVTLLTNGAQPPSGEDAERLRRRGVSIETAGVERLIARGTDLEAVATVDGRHLPFGALFIAARWTLSSPLAEQLGCETDDAGNAGPIVKTDAFKESTVPGVYVAGDAARLYGNATLASADGVMAGGAAHQSLIFPRNAA